MTLTSRLPARRRGALAMLSVAASLAVLSFSGRALADAPFTLERTQWLGGIRFGSDNLELGVGARGGYTLDAQVYIGGFFDYFFGEDEEFAGGETEYSVWFLGADAGYDFGLTQSLMIRPFGGLGLAHGEFEACNNGFCVDDSESDLILELGGMLLFSAGSFVVGPELRFLVWDDEALVLGGNIGAAF